MKLISPSFLIADDVTLQCQILWNRTPHDCSKCVTFEIYGYEQCGHILTTGDPIQGGCTSHLKRNLPFNRASGNSALCLIIFPPFYPNKCPHLAVLELINTCSLRDWKGAPLIRGGFPVSPPVLQWSQGFGQYHQSIPKLSASLLEDDWDHEIIMTWWWGNDITIKEISEETRRPTAHTNIELLYVYNLKFKTFF